MKKIPGILELMQDSGGRDFLSVRRGKRRQRLNPYVVWDIKAYPVESHTDIPTLKAVSRYSARDIAEMVEDGIVVIPVVMTTKELLDFHDWNSEGYNVYLGLFDTGRNMAVGYSYNKTDGAVSNGKPYAEFESDSRGPISYYKIDGWRFTGDDKILYIEKKEVPT